MADLAEILVAESSQVLRSLLSRLFRPMAGEVLEASNVEQARSILERADDLSLILLDANLEGGAPLEILEQLATDGGPAPAVVVILRRPDVELETRASLLGAIGVVTKPVTFGSLMKRIRPLHGPMPEVAPRVHARPPGTAIILGDEDQSGQVALPLHDLSATGALIASRGAIPLGARLRLLLRLEHTVLRTDAVVVRVQHPAWGTLPGIGVVFEEMEAGGRELIERYVALREPMPFRDPPV